MLCVCDPGYIGNPFISTGCSKSRRCTNLPTRICLWDLYNLPSRTEDNLSVLEFQQVHLVNIFTVLFIKLLINKIKCFGSQEPIVLWDHKS